MARTEATDTRARVLILGANGMLGHTLFRVLSAAPGLDVHATVRSAGASRHFTPPLAGTVVAGVDVLDHDHLVRVLEQVRPGVIINCVGLVKQIKEADDPLSALPINALLPHRLAHLAALAGARLVHISTDCVFAGTRGGYREDDVPDATDLYGRSKLLGEICALHAVTLRTSIIGPELGTPHGLVGWFLAQSGPVRGYTRAIFSGLPTVELATVIRDHVLPRPDLRGLYHVSAEPIDKHTLLGLVAATYGRSTVINPDDGVVIDRSLDSSRFRGATGYEPAPWPELIARMQRFG